MLLVNLLDTCNKNISNDNYGNDEDDNDVFVWLLLLLTLLPILLLLLTNAVRLFNGMVGMDSLQSQSQSLFGLFVVALDIFLIPLTTLKTDKYVVFVVHYIS